MKHITGNSIKKNLYLNTLGQHREGIIRQLGLVLYQYTYYYYYYYYYYSLEMGLYLWKWYYNTQNNTHTHTLKTIHKITNTIKYYTHYKHKMGIST